MMNGNEKNNRSIGEKKDNRIDRRRFVTSLGIMAGVMATPGLLRNSLTVYAESSQIKGEKNEEVGNKPKPSVAVEWFNVRDYHVKGDGITDDASSLKELINMVSSRPISTIYFPAGNYRLGKNLTFPENVCLIFDYGSTLHPEDSVVLEVFSSIDAGVTQIFGGTGEVKGTFDGNVVYPQWWGATGNKEDDDVKAFQKVFRLAKDNDSPMTIYVPRGDYVWGSPLVIYGNTSVVCEKGATFWRNHENTMLQNYEYNGTPHEGYAGNGNILFENASFEFVGLNPSFLCYEDGNVLQFAHASDWVFKSCRFYDLIDAHAIEVNSSRNVSIEGCEFYGYRELADNRWYVEAIQIDHAGKGGITGVPLDGTHCENVSIRKCIFGKGRSYTFKKDGLNVTVDFKGWPAGVGGHTHQENKWHQNITIKNNIFEGMRYYAIRPYKWINAVISDNTFNGCGGGIYAVSGSKHDTFGEAGPFKQLSIINNQFINGKEIYPEYFQENKRFAIGIFSNEVVSEDVKIEGNILSIAKDSGIIIQNVNRVSISNNTISEMDEHAIEISECLNVMVGSNQIFKPKEKGISLEKCNRYLIKDNQIEDTQMESLAIRDGTFAKVYNNMIIKSSDVGINCENLDGLVVKDNTVSNTKNCINIKGCEDTNIVGNHVSQANTNYISIIDTSILYVAGNFVRNKKDSSYDAITFSGSTNTGIVRDNIIKGKYRHDIWFENNTDNIKYGYNLGTIKNDSDGVEALKD